MSSKESRRSKTSKGLGSVPRPKTLPAPPVEFYARALARLAEAEARTRDACVVVELTPAGPTDLDGRRRMLEDLARRIGVDVRYEPLKRSSHLASSGGLCKLRSRFVILVDAEAPAVDQVGVLRDALSRKELRPFLEQLDLRLDLDDG